MNRSVPTESLPVAGEHPSRLPKIAVVTTAAPPSASGQARVLGHLMVPARVAPPVYLTDQLHALEADGNRFGSYHSLGAPRHQLISHAPEALRKLNNYGGLLRSAMSRTKEITSILRNEPVDAIVGCTASPFDLPAAYFASRRLKVPFVAYLFDDPIFQWEPGIYRWLARFWEPIWGRGAAAIIAPNEVLANDVRARLPAAKIYIVRNPVDPAAFSKEPTGIPEDEPERHAGRPCRLLYTGSVYSAQASAFRNLNAALNRLAGRFELDVYTSQPISALVANGLEGPYVRHHAHTPQSTALSLQRNADVLFLPLSFDSAIPEAILSSSPAKLGEYLAAGTPILVHAPSGSFATELLRKADAALIVDTSDPDRLVTALTTISNDPQLRRRLAEKAALLAEEFHVDRARDAFCSIISSLDY
ncbi:glycosyltransferase involved in cell wall biosynthesis [Bradyrhizobium sp. USDA 326]|uniref:glycosyltransferase n=1 Tax=Bradyrhizobium sp. USDA 326 TaxID=3377726 RepID=UPI003C74A77C